MGYPGGPDGKESACKAGSFPGHGKVPWRRAWPLQYSCLENLHGQRSLVGRRLWGHKEPDVTEWLSTAQPAEYPIPLG